MKSYDANLNMNDNFATLAVLDYVEICVLNDIISV